MKLIEDPRMREGRRNLVISYTFFFAYIVVIMYVSYSFSIEPLVWGLPRWVAIGNIIVPLVFVVLLIYVTEKFMKDIPLIDEDEKGEE